MQLWPLWVPYLGIFPFPMEKATRIWCMKLNVILGFQEVDEVMKIRFQEPISVRVSVLSPTMCSS